MKHLGVQVPFGILLGLSACSIPSSPSTQTPLPSPVSPPATEAPTSTATYTPTETPIPATPTVTLTPTAVPQPVLLRRPCGRDHMVRANEPIVIFYGGWAVKGLELAQQWESVLTTELLIDGTPVEGELQPPAADLPHNCPFNAEDSYWLFHTVEIAGLTPGVHDVIVAVIAMEPLPDGYGFIYGPGRIAEQTFRITAQEESS